MKLSHKKSRVDSQLGLGDRKLRSGNPTPTHYPDARDSDDSAGLWATQPHQWLQQIARHLGPGSRKTARNRKGTIAKLADPEGPQDTGTVAIDTLLHAVNAQ
ncbi:MAG: hypothetical protein ACTHWM_07530 [Yaniella sp.]|uniref:hypothetical protein n=1 Tax=Yaniella sp. TaxID=2773929 RepID=UPI003F9DC067